jgi:hypothetical protein
MSVVKNELKRAGKIVTTQATEDGNLLINKYKFIKYFRIIKIEHI